MPTKFFIALTRTYRVTEDPHPVIVQRVRFRQVKYIEFDCEALECVSNAEEIPLSVTICVDIVLKHEVVLLITDFHCSKQIPSLESRLEN